MESNERELKCFKLLTEVFMGNAYGSLQLNNILGSLKDEKDKAYISNLFYGVLEKNVQFDYIICRLAPKKPKTVIEIIIKMGLYHIRYMKTPSYAAINETVELTKRLGKGAVSGFVNAVLRKSESFELPKEGSVPDSEYLSVTYSVPLWICKNLIRQYGYEFAKAFLAYESTKKTHIRHNNRLVSKDEFENRLSKFDYDKSKLGFFVSHNSLKELEKSTYTIQSLASMIAVNCYLPQDIQSPEVLDLCGAPGGKSIYLEELCPSAKVTCCDIHPHRVDLIRQYAARMKSGVKPKLNDALSLSPEWFGAFDIVICDVPCSGLGVYKSKPDILINKQPFDIDKVKKVQGAILDNAKKYVKVGGVLCYSTCTVFKEENDDNVNEFLRSNDNFVLDKIECSVAPDNDGMIRLFPHINEGSDGFFVARLRRVR